jgi:energy-coupling factor transport system ATP-binding protein
LASVLVTQPDILILDEPTDGLDARSQREIMDAVQRYNAGGGTVLLITHDLQLVASYAGRVVALSSGRAIFDGAPSALFGEKDILAEAGLMPPRVWRLAKRLARPGMPEGVMTSEQFAEAWVRLSGSAGGADEASGVVSAASERL